MRYVQGQFILVFAPATRAAQLRSNSVHSTVISHSSADILHVHFTYSSEFGGSILAHRRMTGSWNWLTTTEYAPVTNNPENDSELGAWKWSESGYQVHHAIVGIGEEVYSEIGIGSSDIEPMGSQHTGRLYEQPGTQVYAVTYSYGKLSWKHIRTITEENSWCPRGDCTLRNPAGTVCENDAQRLATTPIYDGNKKIGDVFVVWSAACQAVWGKSHSEYNNTIHNIHLNFLNDSKLEGLRYNNRNDPGLDRWTDMASQNVRKAQACADLVATYGNKTYHGYGCANSRR